MVREDGSPGYMTPSAPDTAVTGKERRKERSSRVSVKSGFAMQGLPSSPRVGFEKSGRSLPGNFCADGKIVGRWEDELCTVRYDAV